MLARVGLRSRRSAKPSTPTEDNTMTAAQISEQPIRNDDGQLIATRHTYAVTMTVTEAKSLLSTMKSTGLTNEPDSDD